MQDMTDAGAAVGEPIEQIDWRIDGDGRQPRGQLLERAAARGDLHDEPVVRTGDGAAADRGQQTSTDHAGFAAATRPDESDEPSCSPVGPEASDQTLDHALAAEEVGRVDLAERLRAHVGVVHDRRDVGHGHRRRRAADSVVQSAREGRGVLEAIAGAQGRRLIDEVGDRYRDVDRWPVPGRADATERPLEHAAQTEDVGPRREWSADDLLGGVEALVAPCRHRGSRRRPARNEAESIQEASIAFDEDRSGLDPTVDVATLMRRAHR